jgi:hypothetical protein
MQLGLGQAADEGFNVVHTSSLPGEREIGRF